MNALIGERERDRELAYFFGNQRKEINREFVRRAFLFDVKFFLSFALFVGFDQVRSQMPCAHTHTHTPSLTHSSHGPVVAARTINS